MKHALRTRLQLYYCVHSSYRKLVILYFIKCILASCPCSLNSLRIHSDPDQNNLVTEDEWMNKLMNVHIGMVSNHIFILKLYFSIKKLYYIDIMKTHNVQIHNTDQILITHLLYCKSDEWMCDKRYLQAISFLGFFNDHR